MTVFTVLLVEDSSDQAHTLAILLHQHCAGHFDVVSVATLERAILNLDGKRFAAVLLDLFLPDSRGVATLRKFQEACRARKLDPPIIVLTCMVDEATANECYEAGAVGYFDKAVVNVWALVRTIEMAITGKTYQDAIQEVEAVLNDCSLPFDQAKLRIEAMLQKLEHAKHMRDVLQEKASGAEPVSQGDSGKLKGAKS